MSTARLELALERLQPSDWERFERLASAFLASEFTELRTVAWPSGDKGRDAQLWSSEHEPSVMMQYSVTESWKAKIRKTAANIRTEFPSASLLIYLTNQALDPNEVDELRIGVRKSYRLSLDVRDRRWFLERWERTATTVRASEELAQVIVDPYLASRGLFESKGQALNDYESRVSFVYLALQWEDDTREKGLTRLCFEAMARAALRDTHSDARLKRSDVHQKVSDLLPGHDAAEVKRHIDSALTNLTKRHIRHWQKEDEFCLTNEEVTRVKGRLVTFETLDADLKAEIQTAVQQSAKHLRVKLPDDISAVASRVRRVLEKALALRGEMFAAAAVKGGTAQFEDAELADLLAKDVAEHPELGRGSGALIAVARSSVESLLVTPSSQTHGYLRSLVDSYTLMAFLRQTPDVQNVVSKMFSGGELWLDTNIVLPLIAETLCPDEGRQYTVLLRAATEAGLQLCVTSGVLEEVESNLNRARVYASRNKPWTGSIPFMYSAFVWSRQAGVFQKWLEQFVGRARPLDDLAAYLDEEFRIQVDDLEQYARVAPVSLRSAVTEYWREVHERRRENTDLDDLTLDRLIEHDVENCLGVVQKRGQERDDAFGYRTWWLTLDRAAYRCMASVSGELGRHPPIPGPALSPDFLAGYLSVGPARRSVTRGTEHALPLMLDLSIMEAVPAEFIQASEAVREDLRGLPDRVRRRRIRDTLDLMRRKEGPLAKTGPAGALEAIKKVLLGEE